MRASRLSKTLALVAFLPIAACTEVVGVADPETAEKGEGGPNTLKGVLMESIEDFPGRPFGLRTSGNGDLFVTQQDLDRVTFAPRAGGRSMFSVGTDPGDVILTAEESVAIVSTFYGGELHFLAVETGEELRKTRIGSNAYRLLLSEGEGTVFVTTNNGTVHAVSTANGAKTDSVYLGGSLHGIARRDGVLAVSSATTGWVTLLDAATLDVIKSKNVGYAPQDLVYSEDGTRLFVAQEYAGRVLVLDAASLAPVDSIQFEHGEMVGFSPFGMALSPDGNSLVVGSARPGGIAVIDPATFQIVSTIPVPGAPRRIAFKPDGSRAYIANEAGFINVIR